MAQTPKAKKAKKDVMQIKKELKISEDKARKSSAKSTKVEPLGPGQKYFEAPDGTIIAGEESANHILYRMKDPVTGKVEPIRINPKR